MADTRGMKPDARQSLQNAMSEMRQQGIPFHLNSGYRSPQEQAALYRKAQKGDNPYPVAPPGQSRHQLGVAADLGIQPQHREQANAILAKHGWSWNGPSDEVHYDFTSALPQGKGDGHALLTPAQARAAADRIIGPSPRIPSVPASDNSDADRLLQDSLQMNSPQQASSDPVASQYYGGGSTGGSAASGPDPIASQYFSSPMQQPAAQQPQSQPQDQPGYLSQWWSNVTGNNGASTGQRVGAFIKPGLDLINWATGHQLGNVLQHTWNPLLAGVDQSFNQENLNAQRGGGEFGAYGPAGRSAIWQSMVRAFHGQSDPSLPTYDNGAPMGPVGAFFGKVPDASGMQGLSPMEAGLAKFASLEGQDMESAADFLVEWEASGKFAHTFFSPVLRGAGTALGQGIGAALENASESNALRMGKPLGAIADLTNKGIYGVARDASDSAFDRAYQTKFGQSKLGRSVLAPLQSLTFSGPDLRQGEQVLRENTAFIRTTENEQARINNMIADYSKKIGNPTGNSLEGTHWMDEFPEASLNGRMNGNLVGQFAGHYAEATDPSGFFDNRFDVLEQAAKRGIDPRELEKIGEEIRKLNLGVGQAGVEAGVMDPDTLAEHAGNWVRHIYDLTNLDKDQASLMAQDLSDKGYAGSRTMALVQNVAENGGKQAGGRFINEGGLRDVIKQRDILDPATRLAHLPNLDYTASSRAGLRLMLNEIAKANVMRDIGNPALGLSVANKLMAENVTMPPVTEQPGLKGESMRNAKQLATWQESFEQKGGINDQNAALAGASDKAYQGAQETARALQDHLAAEPPMPEKPAGTALPASAKTSFADTAEQRVAKQYARRGVVPGLPEAKGRVAELKDQASLNQYAKDLSGWQKQHTSWETKRDALADRAQKADNAAQRAQANHDAHTLAAAKLDQEATTLRRRNEILSGQRAPDMTDAADALARAMKKVDPSGQAAAAMSPAQQQEFMNAWMHNFTTFNKDIFSEVPEQGLPRVPAGMDPKVVEAMGTNNPLIGMALSKALSAGENEITAADAYARGMTRYPEGYGPMSGRWGSLALKNLIDHALDPDRFIKGQGELGGAMKFFGEMLRSSHLYLNPVSHANVIIQSVADNMATAAEAGKKYLPQSDIEGRKEWTSWMHGGPETPAVKAINDFGNEMAGGPRNTVDPYAQNARDLLSGTKLEGAARKAGAFKDFWRQRFVDEQVLPKVGLTKVLMDQGVDPHTAAEFAERAHGGAGASMGGLETPGMEQMAEVLNRNGIAMFTSYPLHSATRFLQLLQDNPKVVMAYPILRNYLTQQSSPEMQQEVRDKKLGYTEVPLPLKNFLGRFMQDRNGLEGVTDISNAIPYGGAFGDMNFPNYFSPFTESAKAEDRIDKSGLNPIDARGQKMEVRVEKFAPGTLVKGMRVWAAAHGQTPYEGATQPQTVQQSIAALFGFPFHQPETGLTRAFDASKAQPIGGRENFGEQLQARFLAGYTHGEPDMTDRVDLQRMDPVQLQSATEAAIKELSNIYTDRTLNDKQAKGMITNQFGYIHSLMKLAQGSMPRATAYEQSYVPQQ